MKEKEIVEMFKTLGHEGRLKTLEVLGEGRQNVSEIAKKVGIQQSLMSPYLKSLHKLGLLEREREKVTIYYKLSPLGEKVLAFIKELKQFEQK